MCFKKKNWSDPLHSKREKTKVFKITENNIARVYSAMLLFLATTLI